jgi:hypothetical protein
MHAQMGYAFPFLAPPGGDPEQRVLLLTNDGLRLHGISISRSATEGDLDHTRKNLVAGMSPQEATAIEVDKLRARAPTTEPRSPRKLTGHGDREGALPARLHVADEQRLWHRLQGRLVSEYGLYVSYARRLTWPAPKA